MYFLHYECYLKLRAELLKRINLCSACVGFVNDGWSWLVGCLLLMLRNLIPIYFTTARNIAKKIYDMELYFQLAFNLNYRMKVFDSQKVSNINIYFIAGLIIIDELHTWSLYSQ